MIRWVLVALGCLSILAALGLGLAPDLAERAYGSWLGLWIPRVLSLLSGWTAVAVAPLLLGAVVGMAGVLGVRDFRRARAGGRGRMRALAPALAWPVALAAGALAVFYLSWGLNYARPPLESRLGLASADSIGARELEALAREATAQANAHYRLVHGGSDDAGEPTRLPFSLAEGSVLLEGGWSRLVVELGLPAVIGQPYGQVKATGVSWILEAFDISGVFSPFTGEALINGRPPAVSIPAVMAHEQAHQRGFAPEDEASFMGILAAIRSPDPMVRYSAWARLTRTFAADLARADREARRALTDELSPGVRRDWQAYSDYWEENRSAAAPVARAVNDRYLRAHGVEGGILSYRLVTRLLVAWARAHGGSLVPE
jgi:hypothetical protein